MKTMNIDIENAHKHIKKNKHNNITATYIILLNKNLLDIIFY